MVHEEIEHRAPSEILDELACIESEIHKGMSELKGLLG
jgi:type I restriction enzyme M protein